MDLIAREFKVKAIKFYEDIRFKIEGKLKKEPGTARVILRQIFQWHGSATIIYGKKIKRWKNYTNNQKSML